MPGTGRQAVAILRAYLIPNSRVRSPILYDVSMARTRVSRSDTSTGLRIESTPLYTAWRDLWMFRAARASLPVGLRIGLLSATGMVLGFIIVLKTESPLGTVSGVAVMVSAPMFVQWSRGLAHRRQFRVSARQRSTASAEIEATRHAWRDYLKTLRPSVWWAGGPRVPPSGLWPVDAVVGVVFKGPLALLALTNVRILPPSIPLWFWIALLCVAMSLRGALAVLVRRRRLRSLEDACSGDACCWCGYSTTRLNDGAAYPSRCPECGVESPCSPPDLPGGAPTPGPRAWR